MLCFPALGILFAGMVSFTNSDVVGEKGLPIFWKQSVSQLTDLPIENGVFTPNPWYYLHRMSFYKMIIAATDPYLGSFGMTTTDIPVWKLVVRLGWELTSGRLADPTGTTTCGLQTGDPMCISTQSWWACSSYLFSALPFLSAVEQGLLGEGLEVKMQVPAGGVEFCTTYAECAAGFPDIMTHWDAFYQGLKAGVEWTLPYYEKQDHLYGLYWAAYLASIRASTACDSRQKYYSSVENTFAKSMMNAFEYAAAAHFKSNLEESATFIGILPSRVLQRNDRAPNIADLSQEENHTLMIMSWIDYMGNRLSGAMLRLWRRAMCSPRSREEGMAILKRIYLTPGFISTSLSLTTVIEMAAKC